MIANLAKNHGSEIIKKGRRVQTGAGRVEYRYSSQIPLFAMAQELGQQHDQYARIVCHTDGSPATRMTTSQSGHMAHANFAFDPGVSFCVVEVQRERFSITRIVLEQDGEEYRLCHEDIVEHIPVGVIARRTVGPQLACFIPAIEAGVKRSNCPNCAHVHYSEVTPIRPSDDELTLGVKLAIDDPSGEGIVEIGASESEKTGFETTYTYGLEEEGAFVIGEERSEPFKTSTVICDVGGAMRKVWRVDEVNRVSQFRLAINFPFILIRVEYDKITVSRCTMRRLNHGYRLTVEELDPPVERSYFLKGMLAKKLKGYTSAIRAAITRRDCDGCTHTHYGRI